MPASCEIAVWAVAINLSYALRVNSKSLPTHTNIHLFINILSHTCSFMSSLFVFFSRTQPLLLFYNVVIPELTAAIFLLRVLGFNFFFSKVTWDLKEKHINLIRWGQSVQYYSAMSEQQHWNKQEKRKLINVFKKTQVRAELWFKNLSVLKRVCYNLLSEKKNPTEKKPKRRKQKTPNNLGSS